MFAAGYLASSLGTLGMDYPSGYQQFCWGPAFDCLTTSAATFQTIELNFYDKLSKWKNSQICKSSPSNPDLMFKEAIMQHFVCGSWLKRYRCITTFRCRLMVYFHDVGAELHCWLNDILRFQHCAYFLQIQMLGIQFKLKLQQSRHEKSLYQWLISQLPVVTRLI